MVAFFNCLDHFCCECACEDKHYSSDCSILLCLYRLCSYIAIYTYTTYNRYIATLETMTLIRETLTSGKL